MSFYNISQQEMEGFLLPRGFKQLTLEGTLELVYGKIVGKNLCLRVYTAINPNGSSRDKGKDAIRFVLVTKVDNEIKLVGMEKKCLRVKSWQKNMMERLDKWNEQLTPNCPLCNSPTVLRKGKYGEFCGCIRYPECKGVVKGHGRQEVSC